MIRTNTKVLTNLGETIFDLIYKCTPNLVRERKNVDIKLIYLILI